MLPSRGAKRITLRLNGKEDAVRRPSSRWGSLSDAPQPPARVPTPMSIRPPSQESRAPLRRPSMRRTGQVEDVSSSKSDKQEAVKSQLESITGRMFALLNDYDEDPESKTYADSLSVQDGRTANPEMRGDIQVMLRDYNEVCIERDELLFSLQDWFEEGHIDDLLQDMSDGQFSFSSDPEALKQSLMESKAASERLKVVKDQIKQGGGNASNLIQEKDELERKILKSKTVFDALKGNKEGQGTNQEVAHSWKFAAGEIFSVLTKVRNDGLVDLHELEAQVKRLVDTIDQQASDISALKDQVQQHRELVKYEEFLKHKLTEDNDFLSEEVKDMTQRLSEYCKKLKASEEQVKQLKKTATDRRGSVAVGKRPANSTATVAQADSLQQQVDHLNGQCKGLKEEKVTLKQETEDLRKLVQELRDQLASIKEESTVLPKIQQATPSRLVSASTGGGGSSEGGDDGKSRREKVVCAREGEEEEVLAKLRQTEEQLLALREDSEHAAAEAREMSQGLRNAKEENVHLQQGMAIMEEEYDKLQQKYNRLENKMKELQGSPTDQTGLVAIVTPSPPVTPPKKEGAQPSSEVSEGVVVGDEPVDGDVKLSDEESGKVASLQLVVQMMQKLNAGAGEFDEADSSSLKYINEEMHRICANIQTFLEYSTDLINREANIVSEATGCLQKKLQEAGGGRQPLPSPASSGPNGSSQEASDGGLVAEESAKSSVSGAVEDSGQRQQQAAAQDLQARVQCIGQQAMDALKSGEKVFTQSVAEQRKKLTSVVQAMAKHKRSQPKSWQFPVSKEEGLFLDARTHHMELLLPTREHPSAYRKPASLIAWQQRLRNIVSRQGGDRLTELPAFLRADHYSGADATGGFGSKSHTYGSTENIGRGGTFNPMVIRGTRTSNRQSGVKCVAMAAKTSRAKSSLARTHPLGGKRWGIQQRKNHFQFGTEEASSDHSGLEVGATGKHQSVASLPLIRQQNGRVDCAPQPSPTRLPTTAHEQDKRTYFDLVSHTISPFAQSSTRGEDGRKKDRQQRARRVKLPDIHTNYQ